MQYISEVPLWVHADDRVAHDRIRHISRAERHAVEALANWMHQQRNRALNLGPFPIGFTHFNDAGLRHMLPRVIREHSEHLAALETDAAAYSEPEVRSQIESILERKRAHATELASLAAGG